MAAEMTFVTVVTIVVLVSNMATTPVAALLSSTRQAGYTVLDPEVHLLYLEITSTWLGGQTTQRTEMKK